MVRGVVLAALALLVVVPGASAAKRPSRYSLAGGCYALRGAASGTAAPVGAQLRMQATDLGSYLLYRPDKTVLAAKADGSVAPDPAASPQADWVFTDAGGGAFTLSPMSDPGVVLRVGAGGTLSVAAPAAAGASARISFVPAKGCADYPEAELGATGKPFKGKTSYGKVDGLLEGHMHWMTYEYLGGDFHCGRPWSRYGIPYALPDCSGIEGPQGSAAPIQNFLNYGQPVAPHDTAGWPKLTSFGAHNVTYEGTYWRWIQRAWMGGLRMMVMSVNENRVLCELQSRKRHSCDEMETVRQGFKDIRELQRYVDAQAGGPGKGFFQIVTSPYQARRVINKGKMAVVLEIEASELFGCRGPEEASTCDTAQIDRELNNFYDMGVRSSLLLNKFDNPLTGVRFDSGPVGALINAANKQSYGSFWSAKTCTGPLHDNTIESGGTEVSPVFSGFLNALGVQGGSVPTYPPAPHCNTRGLTDLGVHLEQQMMQKHMIINPDHMSQAGVADTLTLAEAHHYSGLISPHGWMDPGNWPRIWKLGGLAFPDSNTSPTYLADYSKFRPKSTPYLLGWGYGADLGGLAEQPDPPADNPQSIKYPFKSYDGKVKFTRETTGERTFDYNKEGVATYGQYADWYADLQRHGSKRLTRDMRNGAEAYLEMWERADGVRGTACRTSGGRVDRSGLRGLRLRSTWVALLRRAGQPQTRNRAWAWCVRGKRNRRAADVAELSKKGQVELVGTTAHGRSAGGVPVGAPARRLAGSIRPAGHGLFTRRAGRSTFVYSVRGARVHAVGVATNALARHPHRLRAAMKRVTTARATQALPKFIPNPAATSAGRLVGYTLAGSSNRRLNNALRMLCSLNR